MIAVETQRFGALALAFALPFALYLATLAPTVTPEDSGELIAAAYTLGVPHSPGYPLFTMLGKVASAFPLGNIAHRLNLMSAFFSSLAAALLTWATALLLEATVSGKRDGPPDVVLWGSALAAGLCFATAYETWEQSIVTEVYALNAAVFAGFLVLSFAGALSRNPERLLVPRCFVLGLALTTHPTSLVLLPLLVVTLWSEGWPRHGPGRWARAAAAFALGLLPYVYLPLASSRDPAMDWGDPETPGAFFRAVAVRPRLGGSAAPGEIAERLQAYAGLLAGQWSPVFLLLAVTGLAVLLRLRRDLFWRCLALVICTGPVVTLATNVPISSPDPRVAAENLAQVSVHYIPSYAVVALLVGVGLYFVARRIATGTAARRAAAAVAVLLPLIFAQATCARVDMSHDRLAEDYAANLFAVASPEAVVLAEWDPFYFPLVYGVLVEGRRPDLTVLDRQLLRHSWYVSQWRRLRPTTSGRVRPEIEAFLEAVRPFEAGEPHDPRQIELRYRALLRALVTRTVAAGRDVYFTYAPPEDLVRGFDLESVLVARRTVRPPVEPQAIDAPALRFRGWLEGPPVRNRFGRIFGDYYGDLALERAALVERTHDLRGALELYRRAERFLGAGHPRLPEVRRQIERLERQR